MENKTKNEFPFEIGGMLKHQKKFFEAKTRFVGLGGAPGGGKLWAARNKAALLCLRYPGIRICFISKSESKLIKDIAAIMVENYGGLARLDSIRKKIEWKNGSVIRLVKAKDENVPCLSGESFDVEFILDADDYFSDELMVFGARIRGRNDFPKRIYYIFTWTNDFLKRVFIKKIYKANEKREDFTFIEAICDFGKGEQITSEESENYGA